MLKTLAILTWLTLHPIHVTLTSIDQVSGSDSLKVFVKMYYDDFLLDYQLFAGSNIVEGITSDQPFPEDLMNKYIDEKVNIFVNNKHLKGKLLNQDLSDNELRLNLVYKSGKKPKTVIVRNTIMTGLYNDQANMILIRINNFEEGIKLTSEVTEQTFNVK